MEALGAVEPGHADAAAPLLPNVTASNLTRALKLAGARGLFLGFTAASCFHCTVHEAAWAAYLGSAQVANLPLLARIDGDRESALIRRHEIDELPALVLAWSNRHTMYTGPHTNAAMAAFGAAQLTPPAIELRDEEELHALLDQQISLSPSGAATSAEVLPSPAPLLLLGFFNDPKEEEAEEVDDFVHAALELRKQRPDTAVRGAYVKLTPSLTATFIRSRRWIDAAPSAVLLVGGQLTSSLSGSARGGAYRLDEAHESGRALSEWAAQMALPDLGELTPLTFAAYAATNLPMLIAFVDPPEGRSTPAAKAGAPSRKTARAVTTALRGVGARFRGKVCVVTCDGVAQRTRMLALGLDADAPLPQLAINTKDDRKLPFPVGRAPTEKALATFVADFLGERLPPKPPRGKASAAATAKSPRDISGTRRTGGASATAGRGASASGGVSALEGGVVELQPSTFDRLALDVTKDVLLLLSADVGCDACANLVPYYAKVATRARELGLDRSLRVASLDVKRYATELPSALSKLQLHALPTILMLPAKRKTPPFTLYHGTAKPKELLYFARAHASTSFELPPNPHLTREQHVAWKEQVAELPREKVEGAYERLQQETGLSRDEL